MCCWCVDRHLLCASVMNLAERRLFIRLEMTCSRLRVVGWWLSEREDDDDDDIRQALKAGIHLISNSGVESVLGKPGCQDPFWEGSQKS